MAGNLKEVNWPGRGSNLLLQTLGHVAREEIRKEDGHYGKGGAQMDRDFPGSIRQGK
jgi:hypothetical protein